MGAWIPRVYSITKKRKTKPPKDRLRLSDSFLVAILCRIWGVCGPIGDERNRMLGVPPKNKWLYISMKAAAFNETFLSGEKPKKGVR